MMIERVAQALQTNADFPRESGRTMVPMEDYWRNQARVAIEAMRQTTEAMANAAVDAAAKAEGWLTDEGTTNALWRAMIDAALAEKDRT